MQAKETATDPARPRSEEPNAGAATKSKYLALVAMLFAVAMTFIDQTIVAIASPSIQSHLALTRSSTQWVVNAYLLALAASARASDCCSDPRVRTR